VAHFNPFPTVANEVGQAFLQAKLADVGFEKETIETETGTPCSDIQHRRPSSILANRFDGKLGAFGSEIVFSLTCTIRIHGLLIASAAALPL
jgi:hypothetical protein